MMVMILCVGTNKLAIKYERGRDHENTKNSFLNKEPNINEALAGLQYLAGQINEEQIQVK